MTELDLIELLRNGNDGIDSNFQFWISSSFAVLMAFFFAHGKIVSYVKWTVVSLYVASTVLFFIRLIGNGQMVVEVRGALEAIDSKYIIYGANAGTSIGMLFMTIMVIGTIATMYFCLFSDRIMNE